MEYSKITKDNVSLFHELLTSYYRSAEDKDTPQEEIDAFIYGLFNQIQEGKMQGELAAREEQAVGFVLYGVDAQDGEFSEKPGWGTVYEIGLIPTVRGRGLGRELVEHAEKAMKKQKAQGLYVCAYGPAQSFWKKMGYKETGVMAKNGLPIYEK